MASEDDHLKLEVMTVRISAEQLDRLDRLLKGGEVRSVFVREAIETELRRREKLASRKQTKHSSGELSRLLPA